MDDIKILLKTVIDAKDTQAQLNAIKNLSVRIEKLNLDQSAITELKNQLTKNGIDINLVLGNTNQVQSQAKQAAQQIGNSINASINNTLRPFSELKIGTGNIDAVFDKSGLIDVEASLNRIKQTYSSFGQVKITNKLFDSDGNIESFKVNIEQVNGDLKETRNFMMAINGTSFTFPNDIIKGSKGIIQHLDNTKNVINQTGESINQLKLKAMTDKIQLSVDTGTYESKVSSLIAKTQQWTDINGNARISTQSLSNAFNELNKASIAYVSDSSNLTKQQALIQAEQKLDVELKSVTNSIRTMNAELAKDSTVSSLNTKVTNFISNNSAAMRKFGSSLKSIQAATAQGSKLSNQEMTNLLQQFTNIEMAARRAGTLGKTMFQTLVDGAKTFSYLLSSTFIIMKVITAIKQAFTNIKELDTALVDLKKTTTMTSSQLIKFYYSAKDVAKQMGVTTKQIIEQASAWSRLGYASYDAVTQMAKFSSMFASISPGMDIDTATDGLVSVMKAFKFETDDVLDGIMSKINIIGNSKALDNSDIVEFLTRSSSAMAEANNSLEETIALGEAAIEITRDAASVGQVLKTTSMRIRGYDEETESYAEDLENLKGVIANLTKTTKTPGGISLFTDDTKETYKSTYKILNEISSIWGDLTDKNQAQLLEALAGKRNGQALAAIISNFDSARESIELMSNSAGNAEAEMSIIMDSLDYKLNSLKESGTGIAQNLFNRDEMKDIVDTLTKVAEAIDFVTDKIGLLGTVGLSAGMFAGIKNIGRYTQVRMFQIIVYCFEYALHA